MSNIAAASLASLAGSAVADPARSTTALADTSYRSSDATGSGSFADAMAAAADESDTSADQARRERYLAQIRSDVGTITNLLGVERANASNRAYVAQLEATRTERKERVARNRSTLRGEAAASSRGSNAARAGGTTATGGGVSAADDATVDDGDTVDPDDGWVQDIEDNAPEYVFGEMPAQPDTTSTINGVAPYADPNYGIDRVQSMTVEQAVAARTKGITWQPGQLDDKGKPLWMTSDQVKTYWNNVVDMVTTGGLQPYQVFPEAQRGETAYNMDSKRYLEFLGFWDGSSLWTTRDVNSMPIDEAISHYQAILNGTVSYTGVNTGWGMDNPSTVQEVQSTLDYLNQLKAKGLTNLGLQPGVI